MSTVYRIIRPDGSIEYTRTPQGDGDIKTIDTRDAPAQPEPDSYREAKRLIAIARKRIPKLIDYLDYLDYLRHHSPLRFDKVMRQLRAEDPQTWLKLQKHPQFKPLFDTALGLRAGEKHLSAGIPLSSGNMSGSIEGWLESTVKAMMKRDRFGPYVDVLGSKASSLPAPQPVYSNSRLGQFLKEEDARLAKGAKESAKNIETSRAAIRTGVSSAISRPGNVLIDLGVGTLDPKVYSGISAIRGIALAKKLQEADILYAEEARLLPGLMAEGKYDEVNAMIKAGYKRLGLPH